MNRPTNEQILDYISGMLIEDWGEPAFVDYLGRFGCEILDHDVRIHGDKMVVVLDHGDSETTIELMISVKEKVSQ